MHLLKAARRAATLSLAGLIGLGSAGQAQSPYVYRIPLQGVDAAPPTPVVTPPTGQPNFEDGTVKELSVNALVGDNVSLTISTRNGVAPVTWAQAALPPGLQQSGASITGQPEAPGSSTVDVVAHDALGRTATARVTFAFAAAELQITQNKPALRVGEAFSMSIASNVPGGTYAASGAPGMTLSQGGGGASVAGSATTAGTYPVTVSVGKPGTAIWAGQTSSVDVYGALQLTLSPAQAPTAAGPVSIGANVANGVGAVTVELTSDASALASRGLSFNGSSIAGILGPGGPVTVALRATDAFDGAVADASLAIPALGGGAATIAALPLRVGDVLAAGGQITISSDVPSPACTVTQAVPGVTVAANCQVTGQATSPGQHTLAVSIKPSGNPAAPAVTASATVSVAPALTLAAVNPNPTLLVGQQASQGVAPSGVVGSASYALAGTTAAGLAAIGMTFDPATGSVTGTPSESTNLTYQVVVTDSHDGRTASATLHLQTGAATVTLTGVPGASVRVGAPRTYAATSNIQNAVFSLSGAPSYVTIDASTGVVTTTAPAGQSAHEAIPAYSVVATSAANPALTKSAPNAAPGTVRPALTQSPQALEVIGSLPAGLGVSGQAITGKPTEPGSYSFAIRATDAADGESKTVVASVEVSPLLGFAFTSPNSPLGRGAAGTPMSITAQAQNALGSVSFANVTTAARPQALTGLGLSMTSAGVLSGSPNAAFTGDVNIRMTEVHNGQTTTVDLPLSLVITAPATAATKIPVVTYQGADRTTTFYDASDATSVTVTGYSNSIARFTFSEPVTINGAFVNMRSSAYDRFTNGNLTNVSNGGSRNLNGSYTPSGRQFTFAEMTGTVFEFDLGSSYTNTTYTFRLTYNGQAPVAP